MERNGTLTATAVVDEAGFDMFSVERYTCGN